LRRNVAFVSISLSLGETKVNQEQLFMSERKQAIKAKLSETRDYLNSLLDQVGDRWEQQVYSDGLGWTVRQLVNHLTDADRGHMNQAMTYAEGGELVPADFDIERYNAHITRKTAEKSPAQALEELAAQRQQIFEWLDNVDEAKLDLKGRHASLKMMTVEEILRYSAAHEHQHAVELADALEN
jgi:hypothetical protein